MLKANGGQIVGKGNYWNISNGERVRVESEDRLPGDGKTVYLKLHPILVLAAAPMLGLAYAAFLPFIGMAMLVLTVGKKIGSMASEKLAPSATFTWQPTEAYLAYKKKHKAAGDTTKTETRTDEKSGS